MLALFFNIFIDILEEQIETTPAELTLNHDKFLLSSKQYGDLWVEYIVGDNVALINKLNVEVKQKGKPLFFIYFHGITQINVLTHDIYSFFKKKKKSVFPPDH